MIVRLPPFAPGQTIGLLGGSFNPPHAGHRLISELALRRLRLDRLWWLVTPGNPLKIPAGSPDNARARRGGAAADARSAHRRDRLRGGDRLALHLPDDRLAAAPRAGRRASSGSWAPTIWANFISGGAGATIADLAPIVVVDRPGSTLRALAGRAGARSGPLPPPGGEAARFARLAAARVPVPARAALRPVVDGVAARRSSDVRRIVLKS